MNEPSLIGHAEELVRIIRKSPQPGDAIASDYYRSKKYIGARDRRFIGEWTFRTLRTLALVEAYQVKGAGGTLQGPVEAAVALSRDLEAASFIAQQELTTQINTQQWLLDETLRRWDDAADVWRAMMEEAPFTLRVNLRRTTREKILDILTQEDIPCSAGEHAPGAIIIHKRVNLTQHALYKDGLIEVQDEGSQLIAHACNVQPGMTILDACAGAGGKSLHLADLMQDRGTIIAEDIEWSRLREVPKRARTAGISIIQAIKIGRHAPSNRPTPSTQLFDRVLVDAPCTGMGTVRRLPMVKWRLTANQLSRYVRKQHAILNGVASRVRPGGLLIYATCSILPTENEDVVRTFLQHHTDFTLDAEQQVDPFHHGTDGLYWARMVRG
jgi:16S rRNA (cytosine967-C5)-methyltransferase